MPYVKFILPTAPTQSVTMNMGMAMASWYDIVGLDERSNEKCKGIDASKETLTNLLDKEHQRGIPYNRMALAGFSQGGALSLFTGFQLPADKKIAGILAMSGYLPGKSHFKLTPGLEDIPVMHLHGTRDPLVKFAMAEKSKELLMSEGANNYTLKSYPIQHTVTPEEIGDGALRFFLILAKSMIQDCRQRLVCLNISSFSAPPPPCSACFFHEHFAFG
jgi:lysophospholipase-2